LPHKVGHSGKSFPTTVHNVVNGKPVRSRKGCEKEFVSCSLLKKHVLGHKIFGTEINSTLSPMKIIGQQQLKFQSLGHLSPDPESNNVNRSTQEYVKESIGLYFCIECDKRFHSRVAYTNHVRCKLAGFKQFSCHVCDKSFRSILSLKLHVKQHTVDRHICRVCGKGFVDTLRLNLHMGCHTLLFNCSECPKRCANVSKLKIHMQNHTGEKRYACKECGKAFRFKVSLKLHEKQHKTFRLICQFCGKGFVDTQRLDYHVGYHTLLHQCNECPKRCANANDLKIHMRNHTGENPYTCKECGKTFQTRVGWKLHVTNHHERSQLYECKLCHLQYTMLSSLKAHHMHVHEGKKQYNCHVCMEKFSNTYRLQAHVVIHPELGIKPLVCEQCGKTYVTKGSLKQHTLTHSTYKPHTCHECGKGFKGLHKGLHTHQMKVHQDIVECEKCV